MKVVKTTKATDVADALRAGAIGAFDGERDVFYLGKGPHPQAYAIEMFDESEWYVVYADDVPAPEIDPLSPDDRLIVERHRKSSDRAVRRMIELLDVFAPKPALDFEECTPGEACDAALSGVIVEYETVRDDWRRLTDSPGDVQWAKSRWRKAKARPPETGGGAA